MTHLYSKKDLPKPNTTNRKMPSVQNIFNYWIDNEKFIELDITLFNELSCMACGFYNYHGKRLDRAHIVARVYGGSDDVSNIHLLCRNCHIESEVLNEEYYWKWFKAKNRDARMYDPLKKHEIVGRNLKEFFDLISEQKFFEAAKWTQAIYEFPTIEETEKIAKDFEELAQK